MNEILKSKIRLLLAEHIEKIFEDDDLVYKLQPFMFSDNYAEKMADAALSTLEAQKDLYNFLIEQGEIKE
jgi:hypothetical protein